MKPRRWTELGREAFVRGRVPCFYRGPTWVAWRYREDVFGNTVVGRVTARDVEDYIDLFAAVGSTVPVIDEVNDFRHLTPDDLSPSLIEALLEAAGRAWPRLAGRLLLRDPDLSVDHLAARLGRSVRSLQRDLALGGRTLREVRQHVRSLQRGGRASDQPDE